MDNPGEIMRLCRLCLVKDQVNIPIFDEQGDIRQIFLKISSCLPVKVSKEDQLPKSICDGCSNKLDLLYEFRNSSVNAEKALLSWVSQAIKDVDETVGVATQPVAKPSETQVKEETLEECHAPLVHSNDSMDAQESAAFDENSAKEESDEPPPPKRARRTAAVKAQINIAPDSDDEDDDDLDIDAEPLTKIEDESDESDGDEKDDPSYPDVPGTSADDQPGPSGVGKDGVEAPKKSVPVIPLSKNKNELVCPECSKSFVNKTSLKNHLRSLHENQTTSYQCDICGFKCKGKLTLKNHKDSVHLKNYSFYCVLCGKGFLYESLFLWHMKRVHHKPFDEFPCPEEGCYKIFKNMIAMSYHSYTSHRPDALVYECDQCSEIFTHITPYKKHMRIHRTGPSTYPCVMCDKVMTSFEGYKGHLLVHSDDKPLTLKCDQCSKIFSRQLAYEAHMKKHERKTYPCNVCNKVMTSSLHYQNHLKVHTGERPFFCESCEKRFKNKYQLSVHTVVHTKERPYCCDICKKSYSQLSSLNLHCRKCHAESE